MTWTHSTTGRSCRGTSQPCGALALMRVCPTLRPSCLPHGEGDRSAGGAWGCAHNHAKPSVATRPVSAAGRGDVAAEADSPLTGSGDRSRVSPLIRATSHYALFPSAFALTDSGMHDVTTLDCS